MAVVTTDFSEYVLDAEPNDWGTLYNARNWRARATVGALGGVMLEKETSGASGAAALRWDMFTGLGGTQKFLARVRATPQAVRVGLRMAGTTASPVGLFFIISASGNYDIQQRTPTATTLASGPAGYGAHDEWWLLGESTPAGDVKLKVWPITEEEPVAFLPEVVTTVTGAGSVGFFTFDPALFGVDYFSFATAGDEPEFPPNIGSRYATDFSEHGIGALPAELVKIGNTSGWDIASDGDVGKVLRKTTAGGGGSTSGVYWTVADDPGRVNAYARFRPTAMAADGSVGIMTHVVPGTLRFIETCIRADGLFRIRRVLDFSSIDIVTTPFAWAVNDDIKMRTDTQGGIIRAKVWHAADPEPEAWLETDAVPVQWQVIGKVGVQAQLSGRAEYSFFSVATNGLSALTSFTVPGMPGPFTAPLENAVVSGTYPIAAGVDPNATSYQFEVSYDGGFSWSVLAVRNVPNYDWPTAAIAWQGDVKLRVKAINDLGESGYRESDSFLIWQGVATEGDVTLVYRSGFSAWFEADDIQGLKRVHVEVDVDGGDFSAPRASIMSPLTTERRRVWINGHATDTIYKYRYKIQDLNDVWSDEWGTPIRYRTLNQRFNVHGANYRMYDVNGVARGQFQRHAGFAQNVENTEQCEFRVPISGRYGVNAPGLYGVRANVLAAPSLGGVFVQTPSTQKSRLEFTMPPSDGFEATGEGSDDVVGVPMGNELIGNRINYQYAFGFIPDRANYSSAMEICGAPGYWYVYKGGQRFDTQIHDENTIVLRWMWLDDRQRSRGIVSGNTGFTEQVIGQCRPDQMCLITLGWVMRMVQRSIRVDLGCLETDSGNEPLSGRFGLFDELVVSVNGGESIRAATLGHFKPPSGGITQIEQDGALTFGTSILRNNVCFGIDPGGNEFSTIVGDEWTGLFLYTRNGRISLAHGSGNIAGGLAISAGAPPYDRRIDGRVFRGIIGGFFAVWTGLRGRVLTDSQISNINARLRGNAPGLREYIASLEPSMQIMFDDYPPPTRPSVGVIL